MREKGKWDRQGGYISFLEDFNFAFCFSFQYSKDEKSFLIVFIWVVKAQENLIVNSFYYLFFM